MEHDPILYYLNGSFDLELGGTVKDKYRQIFNEMTSWFIPVSLPDDRIVLDCTLPHDYIGYLASSGLTPGKPAIAGKEYSAHQGLAWGWDKRAIERLKRFGVQLQHPAPEITAVVNSRVFSYDLARATDTGVKGAMPCYDPAHLKAWIEKQTVFPWVAKPFHGNTGLGFILFDKPVVTDKQMERMTILFESRTQGVVVEPWMNRTADISTRFELSEKGAIGSIVHYRTSVTPRGAFYGMVLDPHGKSVSPWKKSLDMVSRNAARALHSAGYFGPVSIDSMLVAGENGTQELVPLLEINARQGMSFIALTLRDRLAPKQVSLFRTIGSDQHHLPATYSELKKALGILAFDPTTRSGILCVTPLRNGPDAGAGQPHRSLFFIAADSEDAMREMDKELTKIISPANTQRTLP